MSFMLFPLLLEAKTCSTFEYVSDLGRSTTRNVLIKVNPSNQLQSFNASGDNILHFRLRIQLYETTSADDEWQLTIRAPDYRPLEVLGPEQFGSGGVFLSKRLPGDNVLFDLVSRSDTHPKLLVKQEIVVVGDNGNPFFSVKDPNGKGDWLELYDNANSKIDKRAGDSVGILVFANPNGSSWSCSGIAVSEDLFLTNWHCGGTSASNSSLYWQNEALLKNALIDFNWHDNISSSNQPHRIKYRITLPHPVQTSSQLAPVSSDRQLDYSLLRIKPNDLSTTIRKARLLNGEPTNAQILKVIHHPLGETKKLSKGCKVIDESFLDWDKKQTMSEFTHNCDTEGGSSGAPVFNLQGQVIGLHHAGFKFDAQCENPDKKNKAVKISEILKNLPANIRKEILGD